MNLIYEACVQNEEGVFKYYSIDVKSKDTEKPPITKEKSNPIQMEDASLAVIKSIAEDSMQQEKNRADLIRSKSDNLIKYVSTTIGIVNAAVIFALDRSILTLKNLFWIVILVDLPLIFSLILAVMAQIMLKALYYPSGIVALKDLVRDRMHRTSQEFEIYRMRCMEEYTNKLCNANNIRAGYIKRSYFSYLTAVSLLAVYVLIVAASIK